MAKLIKSTDIFESDDIFKGIRESATQTIETLDKLNAEVRTTASELKKAMGSNKLDSTKAIKELTDATLQSNKLMKDAIKIDEAKQKAEQQLMKVEAERAKALRESNKAMAEAEKAEKERIKTERERIKMQRDSAREAERKQKAEEKARKLAEAENSAYKQLEKATRDLKNQSKELGAQLLKLESEGKKNTSEFRNLERQYKAVTKQAAAADAQLKNLDKSVGDNFRNVGNYSGAINKLKAGLGELGLAVGVGAIFQSATEKVIEFDQAVADLQAITGASGADLEFYRKQANELGVAVEGGASAVVEAYKLIGSAKPELLTNAEALNEVTKAAITLSQASGMELPEAATALTDAMNQFGAPAEEASKFINVLANGAKFGSAEIPQVTEALLKFGAVANTSNVSIEESTALIEALGEKGLKGAEAGTALRNVMLKLSAPDALPKDAKERLDALGISFDTLNNEAIPFSDRLSALKPLLNDNAALVKTFGTENAVAATNLIANIDRIKELETQMHTQGTATEQATQRTNTLGHALTELKNSFYAMFTQLGSGSGSMQVFIDGIKFLASNLGTIVSVLGKVVTAWVLYRTTLASIRAYQFIVSGGLKDLGKSLLSNISLTKQATTAQKNMGTAAVGAGEAVGKAGKALGSIPWMIIIGFLVEIATKWYDVASGAAEARRQADLYQQAQQQGKEISDAAVKGEMDAMNERLRLLDLESRKRIANGEKESKVNQERAQQEQQIHEDAKKQFAEKIYWAEQWLKKLEADRAKIPSTIQKIGAKGEVFTVKNPELETTGYQLDQSIANQREAIKNMQSEQKQFNDMVDESSVKVLEASKTTNDYSISVADNSKYLKNNTQDHKNFRTELDKVNDYLQRTIELRQQLAQIGQDRELLKLDQQIEGAINNAVALVTQKGEINTGGEGAMYDPVEQMILARYEREKEIIQQRTQFAIDELQRQYDRETELEKQKLKDDRDELLKQEGITKAEKDKINASYDQRLKDLEVEQSQRAQDLDLEKQVLAEKSADTIVKLEDEKDQKITEYNDKMIEGQKQNAQKETEIVKDKNADIIKAEKEKFKTINDLVKAASDFFIKQSEKKVEQIDKELTAANKQYDTLQTLAENGNINAQQSLAEQQRAITELEKEREKEIKRQQRIKLAESVFSTYSSKVESGSKNALAETIRDTTLLMQFISSLPTFESGIEDTGTNGNGIDGRGGFLSVLHPNERVVPKALNERIGSMSNEQLSKLAWEYQNGKIVRDGEAIATPMETVMLIRKIDELKNVIEHKPETNIELGQITQSVMEIVQTTKQGNTKTYNRYRVKK